MKFALFLGLFGQLAFSQNFSRDIRLLQNAFQNQGKKLEDFNIKSHANTEVFFLPKEKLPWTGYYFPFWLGGIASPWQKTIVYPFKEIYKNFFGKKRSAEENRKMVSTMSQEQIDSLSPAEKMDISQGNYDFPFTNYELTRRGNKKDGFVYLWEGFCNGISAACISTPEPTKKVTTVNIDNISVSFSPGDIKALASANYFYVEKYTQLGAPNRDSIDKKSVETKMDPAVLDIAIRKYLGKERTPFVIDIHKGPAIWNKVVVGYKRKQYPQRSAFELASDNPPEGSIFATAVDLEITFLDQVSNPWKAGTDSSLLLSDPKFFKTKKYSYDIFTDEQGNIVGGSWIGEDMPDFAWFPAGRGMDKHMGGNPHMNGDFIQQLINRSASPNRSSCANILVGI